MLLQSFTQFPRLPPEIRSIIWHLALRQPRVHRLRIATPDTKQPLMLQPTETLPRSTITVRTILATCKESRAEALRSVPDSIPLGTSVLRFNKREDVICLVKVDQDVLDGAIAALAKSRARGGEDKDNGVLAAEGNSIYWLGVVQHLAFEVRNTNFFEDFGVTFAALKTDHLPRFVAEFTKLEWLYVVSLPSPDDTGTVTCRRKGLKPSSGNGAEEDTDDGYTDDEGGCEEGGKEANAISECDGDNLRGSWTRGENGLDDWYCWVPSRAKWNYSSRMGRAHYWEVVAWRDCLRTALKHHNDTSDPSGLRRKGSVRVEVMIHFREGVEPLDCL